MNVISKSSTSQTLISPPASPVIPPTNPTLITIRHPTNPNPFVVPSSVIFSTDSDNSSTHMNLVSLRVLLSDHFGIPPIAGIALTRNEIALDGKEYCVTYPFQPGIPPGNYDLIVVISVIDFNPSPGLMKTPLNSDPDTKSPRSIFSVMGATATISAADVLKYRLDLLVNFTVASDDNNYVQTEVGLKIDLGDLARQGAEEAENPAIPQNPNPAAEQAQEPVSNTDMFTHFNERPLPDTPNQQRPRVLISAIDPLTDDETKVITSTDSWDLSANLLYDGGWEPNVSGNYGHNQSVVETLQTWRTTCRMTRSEHGAATGCEWRLILQPLSYGDRYPAQATHSITKQFSVTFDIPFDLLDSPNSPPILIEATANLRNIPKHTNETPPRKPWPWPWWIAERKPDMTTLQEYEFQLLDGLKWVSTDDRPTSPSSSPPSHASPSSSVTHHSSEPATTHHLPPHPTHVPKPQLTARFWGVPVTVNNTKPGGIGRGYVGFTMVAKSSLGPK